MSLFACLQPVASLSAEQFAIRAKIYFFLTTPSAVCQAALFRARGVWILLMAEGWPLSLAGSVKSIDVERVYHPGRERKTSRPGGRNPLFCLLCLFAVRSSRMAFHQHFVTAVILHVRRSYASPH